MGHPLLPQEPPGAVHRSDRVLPSFLHLVAGNGLRIFFNLGALWLVSRLSGDGAVRDTFVVYLSVVGLLELLAGQWLLSTILRFATEEYTETGRMGRTLAGTIAFWLAGALLFCAPLANGSERLTSFVGLPHEPIWALAVCAYPFLSVSRTLLPGFLQAAGRSRSFAYFPLAQPALFAALLMVNAVAPGPLSLAAVVASLVLAETASFLFLLSRVLAVAGRPQLDGPFLSRMTAYGLPFLLMGVGAQIVQNVDILAFQWFKLAEGRAMAYKIAYQIAGYLSMVPNMSILVLLPLFLERRLAGREEGMRRYYAELVPQFLFPLSLGLGLLCTLSGPILAVFDPAFVNAEPALALLFVSVFFATLLAIDSPLFRSYDRVWGVAAITAGMAMANIILDWLLVPRYATTGAAAATLSVFTLAAVARIALLSASLRFRHYDYLLYAAPALAGCILTLAVERVALRLPLALLLAALALFLVRGTRLYRTSTLYAFEHARLPAPLFAALLSCYRWLGRENGAP
ncbi:lipopolysaccharide biosynthesis protein [bacterium]|nr:lipopolysaccharide biosynthesis protein [bacterium]